MKMTDEPRRQRPPWAQWLDRLVAPMLLVGRRLVPRPSEATLAKLSDRDGGTIPTSPAAIAAGHIQKGRAAFETGALGEALHQFGQAIQINTQARWAWHGRGDALQLSHRPAEALEAYTHACELDPKCGLHQAGRSNALNALGRAEESAQAWTKALKLDPSLVWMRDGG
jgi:tetratricopeptide (TPR) repeat protein